MELINSHNVYNRRPEGNTMKWDPCLYDNKHSFVGEYGNELLEFVSFNKEQRVIDIGCGTGSLTEKLSKRCGYVLGIDGSTEMIIKAQKQYPDIDFEVMDALEISYSHEWDIVFSNAVFHWIPNHDLLLSKIYNALKPTGKLVCEFGAYGNVKTIERGFSAVLKEKGYTYRSKFNFTTVEEFGALLTKNGFVIEKIYDYDRPTRLQDGEKGLNNWAKQFFNNELEKFSMEEQDYLLDKLQSKVKNTLWSGQEWIADYRRLRAIAHII